MPVWHEVISNTRIISSLHRFDLHMVLSLPTGLLYQGCSNVSALPICRGLCRDCLVDVMLSQDLDEPVLVRPVRALDPSLRLGTVCVDDLAAKDFEGTDEIRGLGEVMEYLSAVGVDARRDPELVNIAAHGKQHFLCVLGVGETHEGHVRGIIDEDQQCAAWCPLLEPVVVTAVELHHCTDMRPPGASRTVFASTADRGQVIARSVASSCAVSSHRDAVGELEGPFALLRSCSGFRTSERLRCGQSPKV